MTKPYLTLIQLIETNNLEQDNSLLINKILQEDNSPLHVEDEEKGSLLHHAVAEMAGLNGDELRLALNVVLSLISLGADPFKKDKDGKNPLEYANAILDQNRTEFAQIISHCINQNLDEKLFQEYTSGISKTTAEQLLDKKEQSQKLG